MPKLKYKPIEIGDKINDLTVIGVAKPKVYKRARNGKFYARKSWLCKCDCGKETVVYDDKLKSGWTKSCGCKDPKQQLSDIPEDVKKYCHIRALDIRNRCTNPNVPGFQRYGGRGIKCELGDTIKDIVISLSKVPGYFEGAQIDRVDVNGNYTLHHPIHGDNVWIYHDHNDDKDYQCLGNLRWVTSKINTLNYERHKKDYTVKDISMSILTLSGFKTLCKFHNFDPNEFKPIDIEFDLPKHMNKDRSKLFLHNSLTNEEKMQYYDRLKGIYEFWMNDIKNRIINKPLTLKYLNPQKSQKASQEFLDDREKRGDATAYMRRYRARKKAIKKNKIIK